jgi:glycosidase
MQYSPDCVPDFELFNNLRIYQVMVSSFQASENSRGYGYGYGPSHHKGDLRGIINALDYIKSLNVNAIWLTPIFDSSGWWWQQSAISSTGYFARDYFNVDPHFGTNDDLRELVTEAHARNLYVFLDGVFGHHGGIKRASPNGRGSRMAK